MFDTSLKFRADHNLLFQTFLHPRLSYCILNKPFSSFDISGVSSSSFFPVDHFLSIKNATKSHIYAFIGMIMYSSVYFRRLLFRFYK